MNRNEKKTLKTVTKRFDSSVRLALHTYGGQLEGYIDREQDKLDSLPDQIRDSVTGEQIEESIRTLGEFTGKIEEIENALEDILTLAETSSSFKTPASIKENVSTGRRGIDFHAIFPSSLMDKLKVEASRCDLSMNEIVCRALEVELGKEEDAKNISEKAKKVT